MRIMPTQGLDALRFLEGERLLPYDDATGHTVTCAAQCSGNGTIGVGHKIKIDEDYLWNGITQGMSRHIEEQDLQQAQRSVEALLHNPAALNDNQYSALVLWQFNTGALAGSRVQRYINAGDLNAAINRMVLFNKVTNRKTRELEVNQGLVNRRAAERKLWLTEV